ncbi:MAG: arginine repressor [Phycisphaerae bacterium]
MNEKQRRQATLLRLIEQRTLRSQHEIVKLMRDSGFEVTQASISRDARELGLIKFGGRYQSTSGLAGSQLRPDDPMAGLITAVDPVGANLIVIRTRVGAASTVAVGVDGERFTDVIGTIAGDDTLFIAVRSRSGQGRVVAALKSRMISVGATIDPKSVDLKVVALGSGVSA